LIVWARLASVAIGIWLMAAPTLLGYADPGRTVDRILGPLAASAAVVAMFEVVRGVRWIESAVGVALLVSWWALDYPVLAALQSVATGGLLVVLGTRGGRITGRFGGGWTALIRPAGGPGDERR
jgi:hypothetical protein